MYALYLYICYIDPRPVLMLNICELVYHTAKLSNNCNLQRIYAAHCMRRAVPIILEQTNKYYCALNKPINQKHHSRYISMTDKQGIVQSPNNNRDIIGNFHSALISGVPDGMELRLPNMPICNVITDYNYAHMTPDHWNIRRPQLPEYIVCNSVAHGINFTSPSHEIEELMESTKELHKDIDLKDKEYTIKFRYQGYEKPTANFERMYEYFVSEWEETIKSASKSDFEILCKPSNVANRVATMTNSIVNAMLVQKYNIKATPIVENQTIVWYSDTKIDNMEDIKKTIVDNLTHVSKLHLNFVKTFNTILSKEYSKFISESNN